LTISPCRRPGSGLPSRRIASAAATDRPPRPRDIEERRVRRASAGGKVEGKPAQRVASRGSDGDHVCAGRGSGGRTRIRTWVGVSRRFYRPPARLPAGPRASLPSADHRRRRAQTACWHPRPLLDVPSRCVPYCATWRRAEGKWGEIPAADRPSFPLPYDYRGESIAISLSRHDTHNGIRTADPGHVGSRLGHQPHGTCNHCRRRLIGASPPPSWPSP
jgi:hypothetical protein